MEGEKKRCENCWVWVNKDLDTCPNCSHVFPLDVPAVEQPVQDLKSEDLSSSKPRPMLTRHFKFILFFFMSFIAIVSFISAEGIKLNGYGNGDMLAGDLIWLSLISILISGALMFIDYMMGE